MKLLPSWCILCTPCNHAPCHFMQSHIHKVYACLAVTCHLHFWQNDRDLLRATAVAQGWNRYRNKSQHRKLTLEKKILLPLQQGFEPAIFRSWVRRSNHWAIPAPRLTDNLFYQATNDQQLNGKNNEKWDGTKPQVYLFFCWAILFLCPVLGRLLAWQWHVIGVM